MKRSKQYHFVVLKHDRQLRDFAARYMLSFKGAKLQPKQAVRFESLKAYKKVIGVYYDGELVAGYVINEYPHRCFEYLSQTEQNRIVKSVGGRERICEVVAIWKSRSVSRLTFLYKVWPKIVFHTLGEKRRYVFGCAYKGHGLGKRYLLLSPKLVRRGKDENDLNVFYFTQTQFLLTYLVGTALLSLQLAFRSVRSRLELEETKNAA